MGKHHELVVHDLVKQTDTLLGFISILWLEIRKRTFASLQRLGVKEAPIPKLFSREGMGNISPLSALAKGKHMWNSSRNDVASGGEN